MRVEGHAHADAPWSIIGGNLVSATVGVTAAMWIHDPVPAAAAAIAVAIVAMFTLRCVHPPSGAVAPNSARRMRPQLRPLEKLSSAGFRDALPWTRSLA